jgi:hypothetical protein
VLGFGGGEWGVNVELLTEKTKIVHHHISQIA